MDKKEHVNKVVQAMVKIMRPGKEKDNADQEQAKKTGTK